MTSLHPNSLRAQADVRRSVDEKLGQGIGMSPLDAWNQLSNVERVEWVLGELWYGIDGARFHLWIQGQAEREFNGPRYVAAIGRLVEEEDADVGRLMRWTAERGRAVRAGERGEALFSIVPLVWEPAMERAGAVLKQTVERWPDELVLAEMEAGEPFQREVVAPAASGTRYPGCAVGFTEAATERCAIRTAKAHLALEAALFALWIHGASDEELEALADEASQAGGGADGDTDGSGSTLGVTLARWVDFDGTGSPPTEEALAAFGSALDPVAGILGIESSSNPTLHRVKASRLDELERELRPYGGIRIKPDDEAPFLVRMRSSLRMDPYLLLVDSKDILTEEDVSLVCQAVWTGLLVVMGGDSDGAQAVIKKIEEFRPV